jgi:hypothetical protein
MLRLCCDFALKTTRLYRDCCDVATSRSSQVLELRPFGPVNDSTRQGICFDLSEESCDLMLQLRPNKFLPFAEFVAIFRGYLIPPIPTLTEPPNLLLVAFSKVNSHR